MRQGKLPCLFQFRTPAVTGAVTISSTLGILLPNTFPTTAQHAVFDRAASRCKKRLWEEGQMVLLSAFWS